MDFSAYVLLLAIIAGVTELITRLRAKDFWVAVTIVTAAVIGGLFGWTHYYPDLDVVSGIAAGFGASGALTAISIVGKRSSPTPSEDTVVKK